MPAQVAVVLFAQAALPIDPVQIEIIRMLGTGYVAASVSMLALKVPTSKATSLNAVAHNSWDVERRLSLCLKLPYSHQAHSCWEVSATFVVRPSRPLLKVHIPADAALENSPGAMSVRRLQVHLA